MSRNRMTNASLAGCSILICEDEPLMRSALQMPSQTRVPGY
jgi:hypothetical protein